MSSAIQYEFFSNLLGWGSAFDAWIEKASRYRSMSLDSARALMSMPEHFPDDDYVLVLSRVLSDTNATPAVALDACLGLSMWSAQSVWRTAIAPSLAALSRKAWLRLAALPALLPMRDPATRALLKACEASGTGLAQAAAITLAGCAALRRPLSEESRNALENIATDTFALFHVENPLGPTSEQSQEAPQ